MSTAFLLIGCGRIGERHAAIIAKQAKLLAVCDIIESKAVATAALYGAKFYTDYNEMFAAFPQANAVAICTPNGLHAAHSIAALNHHFHVLCEKPMALTSTDCAAMIQAATDAGKKLFIVKQNRFNPPVAAVKKLLEENRLGNILSIQLSCFWNRNNDYYLNTWKGTKALDGGTLFTQFSHFIDLLYWMLGDIKNIQAITKNSHHQNLIEFEDNGAVILEFNCGAIGTINYTVNAFKKNMEGSLTIFGEKGTVKIGGQYLNELEYQQIDNYQIPALPKGNAANQYGNYEGSMSNHAEVYEQVMEAINPQNNSLATNSFEGLKTVEIIERIYKAADVEWDIPIPKKSVL
jgi:predicted dehydrogenase